MIRYELVAYDSDQRSGGGEIPLISWREVVICRDCKQFANNIHGCYCKKSVTVLSDPNGFCAWGVRSES